MKGNKAVDDAKVLEKCKAALRSAGKEEKAALFDRMGDIYQHQGKMSKAFVCHQEAYDGGLRSLPFLEKYAMMLVGTGKGKEADAVISVAMDMAKDDISRARVLTKRGLVCRNTGDYDRGIEACKQAIASLGSLDAKDLEVKRLLGEANRIMGLNLWGKGLIDDAVRSYRSALDILMGTGNKEGIADITNQIGTMNVLFGTMGDALEFLERSVKVMDKSRTHLNIGIVKFMLDDMEGSETEFKTAIRMAHAEGSKLGVHSAQMNLAKMHISAGNVQKARSWIDLAHAGYKELDDEPRITLLMDVLAEILIAEGDAVEARYVVKKALEITRQRDVKEGEARLLQALGLVEKALGDLEKASEYFEKAGAMLVGMNILIYAGPCYMDLAKARREMGDKEGAKAAAAKARELFERQGVLFYKRKMEEMGL